MYVSYCPELDIASCGKNVDQAKKNLKEVILINLEEAQKLGTLDDLLQEAGFDRHRGYLFHGKSLWALHLLKWHYDGQNQAHDISGSSTQISRIVE